MNTAFFNMETLRAKNGEDYLKINGYNLYSSYAPIKEASNYIHAEVDVNAEGYILFGLGLGYHLDTLYAIAGEKEIVVVCFSPLEMQQFQLTALYEKFAHMPTVKIISHIEHLEINEAYQFIMPAAWLKIIGAEHPLYDILLEIKNKQRTYKKFSELMADNFHSNIALGDFHLLHHNVDTTKVACLISAGPSLNETVSWLKASREQVFILCVGAALRTLTLNGITPDAIIITDPKEHVVQQLDETVAHSVVYYLCTASKAAVSYAKHRCILLQEGYHLAELLAAERSYPLLETGGSVATTGYSLLKYFGFKTIVLFGQDLGFVGTNTHAKESSSNMLFTSQEKLLKVQSNNNEWINTLPNLLSFKNWFERKVSLRDVKVYTTALHGAKISGVDYINKENYFAMIEANK